MPGGFAQRGVRTAAALFVAVLRPAEAGAAGKAIHLRAILGGAVDGRAALSVVVLGESGRASAALIWKNLQSVFAAFHFRAAHSIKVG